MSLVATLMQPLINKYEPGTLDKNELRFSRYGAWNLQQEMSNMPGGILTPKNKELAVKSFGNVVKIPVTDYKSVTIGNTRSCTISDSENTSHLISLNFATYSFGFTMYPSQYYNNYVEYAADWQRKMDFCLLSFAATLDTASRNSIELGINSYWPANILSYYPQIGNALQVSQTQKDDFFNQFQAIMMEMDYYDQIHILGSTSLLAMVNRLKNQSSQNAVNQSFQLDPWKWNTSNRVTNAANIESTVYGIPAGQLATINRNDPDAIAGYKVGGGDRPAVEWREVYLPVVGLKVGSYYRNDCADASALQSGTTGLTRTLKESFEFSTDVCFMNAYNSDSATRFSPVVKAQISRS
jgi:hypothetical protein